MDIISILDKFQCILGYIWSIFCGKKSDKFFCKKKLSEIFVRVPPLEFAWNLMLPENEVDTSKCQCATTAKGPPFWIVTFFEIPKININV